MSNDVDCTGDGGIGHTCQLGSLSDAASQALHVACRDTAGNKHTSSDNTDLTAEIDTQPPTQSSWNPAKGATVTTTSPTLTLTLDEAGDCKWSLADQAYSDMSGDCTGDGGPSISCATSGLSEGSEVVYIACRDDTDASPNEDTADTNEHVDYTVDTTLVVITITSVGGDTTSTYSTSDSTPVILLTTDVNGDCRASLTDESYDDMSNDVDCTGDGGTDHTCQLGSLSDAASQAIHVACRDTLGKKHDASSNTDLTAEIDTAVPTQSGWNPAKGATVGTSPTVTLTLNENGDCKWSLTDQAYDDMSGDCSGDGGPSISCATSGLSEGSEVVYIACRDDTDAVPNEDTIATNEHVDYTVDTTPPVITVTSVGGDASSPWSTSDSTPAIVLTTNENGDCRASVTDESYDDMSNDVDCTGDGGTGHTCQLGSLSDAASQAIHVACRDTQGNKHIATDNTNLAAEIDTAVPTQSGWDPAKGATVTTTAPTITLTLGEDGDCKWSLADQAYGDMSGDCTGDGGPSISCATSSLSEGSEVVYIACRDDTDVSPNEDTVATNEHVDYTVSVVQTCTTVCQGSGYSAGTCRQNAGKCTQNGETHVAAGDTYCTGGASADTCCCA